MATSCTSLSLKAMDVVHARQVAPAGRLLPKDRGSTADARAHGRCSLVARLMGPSSRLPTMRKLRSCWRQWWNIEDCTERVRHPLFDLGEHKRS